MQYESSITSGLKDMAKVKVFVHATDAEADADGMAMTSAPRTYLSRLAENTGAKNQTCTNEQLRFWLEFEFSMFS